MTTRYKRELESLNLAYGAALKADISSLAAVVERWYERSMVMIGSGGSFSTASFAAFLHEAFTGQLARAASPLEIIAGQVTEPGAACFTASGRNRDIGAAFTAAALKELTPLSALVMAEKTPLHKLGKRYAYSDVIGISNPLFKDGFLAVASLIAAGTLLIRAYAHANGTDFVLPKTLQELMIRTTPRQSLEEIAAASKELMQRVNLSVLYTNALRPASVDLESRYVEAALGALHTADFRNFGHGRHYWFVKRASETTVLALVGDGMGKLADRTLKLLPQSVPILRVDFDGPVELQALAGLIVGTHVSEGAGQVAGVDPGKPGVPEFGRRLYHLGPGPNRIGQAELNRLAALRRKGIKAALDIAAAGGWADEYNMALEGLNATRFAGVVFDYDGTICDQRERYNPIIGRVANALGRLVDGGAVIGIATGRGPSSGEAIRAQLPDRVWDKIIVGYYNGAVITGLGNIADPIASTLEENDPLLQALNADLLFSGRRIRANEHQISISLDTGRVVLHALSVASSYAEKAGRKDVKVVASSHSIDILLNGQSKLDVVMAVATRSGGTVNDILRIGDKGAWPGNDAEMLDHSFGLTVDEASPSRHHCWGLAPAGVRGLQATLYYLDRLEWSQIGGRLKLLAGEKGSPV